MLIDFVSLIKMLYGILGKQYRLVRLHLSHFLFRRKSVHERVSTLEGSTEIFKERE